MQTKTITVYPGSIRGEIMAPPSKSVMQRICAAVWVRGGQARISNPGDAADDRVMLDLLRAAGCDIRTSADGALHIDALKAAAHSLDRAYFGESGLAARMCIPILALAGREVLLEADESLCRRPMHFFEQVLPGLGIRISTQDGHLPATISGRLGPRSIIVDGSVSSQFITGLLLAYSGAGARDVSIMVQDPVSKPYIDLTLDVMRAAGLKVPEMQADGSFYFSDAETRLSGQPNNFTVAGDWSNAAFWLVAGAIAGPLVVKGLDLFSTQADRAVLGAMMDAGAAISIESEQISVAPASLKAFHFNAGDCPDLFPPMAAMACFASGTSVIEGIRRLRHKESNRAETIREELGKLGADISLQDDYMIIRGSILHGALISSHNDHRIAMMCAVAALRARGPVTVEGAAAVVKSYPRFFDDLEQLGAKVVKGDTF